MKNSKDIQRAIERYLASAGKNAVDLAKDFKVHKTTTCRWITGQSKKIKNSHWVKLEPLIQPYLDNVSMPILPMEEKLLLEAFREFTPSEKETAIREFIIKAEVKKAKKAG